MFRLALALALARAAVATLGLTLAAACREQSPLAPAEPRSLTPSQALASSLSIWSAQITGVTGDGAEYGIFVPNDWKGDVVFYAHGIVVPLAPVSLPGPADWDNAGALRDALGEAGFAVAYSSFSENGYAIKDGIQRTHQLGGIFTSKVGKPKRAFLVGHSLGAQVVQALAETYPGQYSGALAMCGVLGGTRLQTDYIGHTRALFDFFYPGVLPGSTMEMPVVIMDVTTQIQNPVIGAVMANPTGFGLIAASNQVQLAGNNTTELITSLVNALAYHAIGVNDLLSRTHGHTLFDNSQTVYGSALYPAPYYAAVNQGITRYTATPDALAWLDHNYEPTGDLKIPMITVHKTRDRLVPYRHEAAYRARVIAAGASANLVQRSQDAFGHCDFGVTEMLSNFQDLVRWVDTGVKP
jgi:pimeloyl-ACP methyl ester carboxylesterase